MYTQLNVWFRHNRSVVLDRVLGGADVGGAFGLGHRGKMGGSESQISAKGGRWRVRAESTTAPQLTKEEKRKVDPLWPPEHPNRPPPPRSHPMITVLKNQSCFSFASKIVQLFSLKLFSFKTFVEMRSVQF